MTYITDATRDLCPAASVLLCAPHLGRGEGTPDDAWFTVQLSSGDGQFIDVHTGNTGRENFTLGINRSGISDIRLVCRTGGIRVADIEIVK